MDESEKKWSGVLKELDRLGSYGSILKEDKETYLSSLKILAKKYRQHPENNKILVAGKNDVKNEKHEQNKTSNLAKKLQVELKECKYLYNPTIEPLVKALDEFINSPNNNKSFNTRIGRGNLVKLSKHELFRAFELLFNYFTMRANVDQKPEPISDSIRLADEFMLVAGYKPESNKKKDPSLRKQNFDEARLALQKAGITDNGLFMYPWFFN